jgi:hypothetical protein
MKGFSKWLIIIILFFLLTGFGMQRIDYQNGMYKNVCKDLKNNVLIYFVFIDTKETSPWTAFDIKSTIDSMEVAIKWLENQTLIN